MFLRDIEDPELILDCLTRALTVWRRGLDNSVSDCRAAFEDTAEEHMLDAALGINAVVLDMERAVRDLQERRARRDGSN